MLEGLLVGSTGCVSIVWDHGEIRRVVEAWVVGIGRSLGFSLCVFRF